MGVCLHCQGSGKCHDEFHSGTSYLAPFGGKDDQEIDHPGVIENLFGTCQSCGGSNTEMRPPCPHCDGTGDGPGEPSLARLGPDKKHENLVEKSIQEEWIAGDSGPVGNVLRSFAFAIFAVFLFIAWYIYEERNPIGRYSKDTVVELSRGLHEVYIQPNSRVSYTISTSVNSYNKMCFSWNIDEIVIIKYNLTAWHEKAGIYPYDATQPMVRLRNSSAVLAVRVRVLNQSNRMKNFLVRLARERNGCGFQLFVE